MRNKIKWVLVGIIIVLVFLVIVLSRNIYSKSKPGDLYISGHSEQWSDESKKDEVIYYSFTLNNDDNKSYSIIKIEPLIKDSVKSLLLKNDLYVNIEKTVKSNSKLTIQRTFKMDTSKLSKDEKTKVFPIIEYYKIKLSSDRELILKVSN